MSNLTFVKYPSNHNFLRGVRIVLLGGSEEWRTQFIDQINDLWFEEDINFFYVDDKEEMDIERASWLVNQINVGDFLVVYVEDNDKTNTLVNLAFAGINIDNPHTFVLFDETDNLNIVRQLYSSYNKNNFCETESEVIVTMSSIYAEIVGMVFVSDQPIEDVIEEIDED